MSNLNAGAAVVDISPEPGVQMMGYPPHTRENIGIHDPLYASALYLDAGADSLLLICADVVFWDKATVAALRQAIQQRTGIGPERVMLSTSHTHSGPRTCTWLDEQDRGYGYKTPEDYMASLPEKFVGLAADAVSRKQPARIGFGAGRAGKEQGIGGNRHDPDGLCDPAVRVIGVQDLQGGWLACLVKYSLHPAILQEDNLLVSADYPAYIRQTLAGTKPDAVMLFAQGSTGDQSSRFFRKGQTFEEAERFGRAIGREADRVLDRLSFEEDVKLDARSTSMDPELRSLPPLDKAEAQVNRLEADYARRQEQGAPYVDVQTCSRDLLGARFTLNYARYAARGKQHPVLEREFPIEVQAFRIGDACLVGLPGEIFVQYTLDIEKKSPFKHTFVATVTNGRLAGYVVDQDSADKNLFEAGTSLMTPHTGEMMAETARELLEAMHH